MLSRRAFLAAAVGAPLLPLACSPHPDEVTLQGSGATFPAPLYKRWFLEIYRASHYLTRINYQPIGSGAGTRQFREGLTHFGASDDVKKDDLSQISEARKAEALALPMTAGTIVLAYNLRPLRDAGKVLLLTRQNLLDVLLGEITEWDDERLTKLNPDLKKHQKPIIWVRRSDGSGTTAAFTRHLAAVDPQRWTKEMTGKAPHWPVPGVGAKGNDGVSAIVGQTPGALGYVEFGYAGLSKLPFAAMQNKHGEFVHPKRVVDPSNATLDTSEGKLEGGLTPDQIALGSAKLPKDFLISVPDPAAKNAYPIATYTWMLVLKKQRDEKVARALGEMLVWGLTQGQKISDQLDYVPLPEAITTEVLAAVRAAFPNAGESS
jgi:phosphate transport system substrate-binding protein